MLEYIICWVKTALPNGIAKRVARRRRDLHQRRGVDSVMAVDGFEVPDKARYIRRRFSVITVVRQFSRVKTALPNGIAKRVARRQRDLLYAKEIE